MRYFIKLSYRGTHYCGWQRQPRDISVQETLEKVLGMITRESIELTGCGRTDTGVHARNYIAHFDAEGPLPDKLAHSLNRVLPADIAVHDIFPVHPEAHARYDAFERSYTYRITLEKNPFETETAWYFFQARQLDRAAMQEVAGLLPQYEQFFPFCKTDSGVDSWACMLKSADWEYREADEMLLFHITANRFLRGMVRLIVGACIQAGLGKTSVAEIQKALDTQTSLPKSLSVPPEGLCLTHIKYPYL
jgi:tRNA pseudouridine38-40 synthase